jgi:phosphocarrier protein HPr
LPEVFLHEWKKGDDEMISYEYIVSDKQGLHAINAMRLSRAAAEYESRITLKSRKGTADCKNVLSLIGMGARQGECLEFIVEGPDENKAFGFLKEFLRNNL